MAPALWRPQAHRECRRATPGKLKMSLCLVLFVIALGIDSGGHNAVEAHSFHSSSHLTPSAAWGVGRPAMAPTEDPSRRKKRKKKKKIKKTSEPDGIVHVNDSHGNSLDGDDDDDDDDDDDNEIRSSLKSRQSSLAFVSDPHSAHTLPPSVQISESKEENSIEILSPSRKKKKAKKKKKKTNKEQANELKAPSPPTVPHIPDVANNASKPRKLKGKKMKKKVTFSVPSLQREDESQRSPSPRKIRRKKKKARTYPEAQTITSEDQAEPKEVLAQKIVPPQREAKTKKVKKKKKKKNRTLHTSDDVTSGSISAPALPPPPQEIQPEAQRKKRKSKKRKKRVLPSTDTDDEREIQKEASPLSSIEKVAKHLGSRSSSKEEGNITGSEGETTGLSSMQHEGSFQVDSGTSKETEPEMGSIVSAVKNVNEKFLKTGDDGEIEAPDSSLQPSSVSVEPKSDPKPDSSHGNNSELQSMDSKHGANVSMLEPEDLSATDILFKDGQSQESDEEGDGERFNTQETTISPEDLPSDETLVDQPKFEGGITDIDKNADTHRDDDERKGKEHEAVNANVTSNPDLSSDNGVDNADIAADAIQLPTTKGALTADADDENSSSGTSQSDDDSNLADSPINIDAVRIVSDDPSPESQLPVEETSSSSESSFEDASESPDEASAPPSPLSPDVDVAAAESVAVNVVPLSPPDESDSDNESTSSDTDDGSDSEETTLPLEGVKQKSDDSESESITEDISEDADETTKSALGPSTPSKGEETDEDEETEVESNDDLHIDISPDYNAVQTKVVDNNASGESDIVVDELTDTDESEDLRENDLLSFIGNVIDEDVKSWIEESSTATDSSLSSPTPVHPSDTGYLGPVSSPEVEPTGSHSSDNTEEDQAVNASDAEPALPTLSAEKETTSQLGNDSSDDETDEDDSSADENPETETDEKTLQSKTQETDEKSGGVDYASTNLPSENVVDEPGTDTEESTPGFENSLSSTKPLQEVLEGLKEDCTLDKLFGFGSLQETNDNDDDIFVSVVTWNLAEESPSDADATFFKKFRTMQTPSGKGSDLILISGQECENIKPRRSEGSRSREYRRLMVKMLGRDYVPIALHLLGGIQFGLFAKRSFLKNIEEIGLGDVTCGIGNVFHNKGAIGTLLEIKARNESSSNADDKPRARSLKFLFVTAHMAAHVKNSDARDSDFWRISAELKAHLMEQMPTVMEDGIDEKSIYASVDRVFFCGDLNYRIELPREFAEASVLQNRARSIEREELQEMLRYDQLRRTIAEKRAFDELIEGKITFPPTFKFDKGTGDYDSSQKQRIPAWTDRILFKPTGTRVLEYSSVPEAQHSDHRPVYGIYRVNMEGKEVLTKKRRKKTSRRPLDRQ